MTHWSYGWNWCQPCAEKDWKNFILLVLGLHLGGRPNIIYGNHWDWWISSLPNTSSCPDCEIKFHNRLNPKQTITKVKWVWIFLLCYLTDFEKTAVLYSSHFGPQNNLKEPLGTQLRIYINYTLVTSFCICVYGIQHGLMITRNHVNLSDCPIKLQLVSCLWHAVNTVMWLLGSVGAAAPVQLGAQTVCYQRSRAFKARSTQNLTALALHTEYSVQKVVHKLFTKFINLTETKQVLELAQPV